MNSRFLLLALLVTAFSSCSVYKSGQTPDDVYYSPAPAMQQRQAADDSYVDVRQQKSGSNYQSYDQFQDNYRDNRFLRLSIGNPYYLNAYNMYGGFDWRYNSYDAGFNYGFSSPWNNYFAWNNFYNPYSPFNNFYSDGFYPGGHYGGGYYGGGYYGGGYYGGGYYSGIGGVNTTIFTAPISKPRVFNVNNYSNGNRNAGRNYSNGNYIPGNGRYNNTNQNNRGNTYYNNNTYNNGRSTYSPGANQNNNSYSPSRSYSPPASSGGGGARSSGGGGGGGAVSRPGRGN